MRKLLLIAVLILFPLHAQAFDFHGIKAGMSQDQVFQALKALDAPTSTGAEFIIIDTDKGQGLKGVKWSPRTIEFKYDHEGRLYSLVIKYRSRGEPNDPPFVEVPGVAFQSALEKKYGATVEIEADRRSLRPSGSYRAIIVDAKRLALYLDHLITETMAGI